MRGGIAIDIGIGIAIGISICAPVGFCVLVSLGFLHLLVSGIETTTKNKKPFFCDRRFSLTKDRGWLSILRFSWARCFRLALK